jgi:uncharacterized membrane-anchored protein
MRQSLFAVLVSCLLATFLSAQNEPSGRSPGGTTPPAPTEPTAAQEPKPEPERVAPRSTKEALAEYSPVEGIAKLGKVAELKLPEGWVWLHGADGRRFLTDCGNRPGPATLGVAMPADFVDSNVFAVYSYSDEGHVKDDESPDYDALLRDMKESTAAEDAERKKAGVPGVRLLGWAEAPHYDKAQHKLYWAERLQFDGEDGETLNYNVRVLGRAGFLVCNGVGDIRQLDRVAEFSKALLQATEFVEGQRYTDFDPAYDKVAAYGIGGLVAGKLALKVGLFAKLAVLLKAFIKPIGVGLLVIGGLLVKFFTGRKKADSAPLTDRGGSAS